MAVWMETSIPWTTRGGCRRCMMASSDETGFDPPKGGLLTSLILFRSNLNFVVWIRTLKEWVRLWRITNGILVEDTDTYRLTGPSIYRLR